METNNVTPRKRHIVIVDDNAELAWFFSEILKLHGYEPTVFSDAVRALKTHFESAEPMPSFVISRCAQLDGDLLFATVETGEARPRAALSLSSPASATIPGFNISSARWRAPLSAQTLAARVAGGNRTAQSVRSEGGGCIGGTSGHRGRGEAI